jgi:dihydrolipoamide dehydrogenase
VKVHTGTLIAGISKRRGGVRVELKAGDETSAVEASHVLMATGRRPNVADVGLEEVGVSCAPQGVQVDDHMRTNYPTIYAVGDVTGQKLLAHVASHQGIVAAENALGHEAVYDDRVVPACTFTYPEIASVGLTEAQARERHGEVLVGRFPFQALGRARANGDTDGFAKVVAGARHGEVLGVHVIGPGASDIISEGALAIRLEATLDDLRETVHAHPTFPEAIYEAAWVALGQPLHLPMRRQPQ